MAWLSPPPVSDPSKRLKIGPEVGERGSRSRAIRLLAYRGLAHVGIPQTKAAYPASRSRERAAAVLARQGRGEICRLSAFLKAIPSVCPPIDMAGFRGSTKFPPSEKSHDL